MMMKIPLFTCCQESTGGWLVWDNANGRPASIGDRTVCRQTERRARVAAEILTSIYCRGLQAEGRESYRRLSDSG